MPEWKNDVCFLRRRSGSGLCWGATRRGIAGRKLTVMLLRAGARMQGLYWHLRNGGLLHHRRFPHALKTQAAGRQSRRLQFVPGAGFRTRQAIDRPGPSASLAIVDFLDEGADVVACLLCVTIAASVDLLLLE